MQDQQLAEIRARDDAEIPRLMPPDGEDPYLRAAMDRRDLLAEVDRLRTEITEKNRDLVYLAKAVVTLQAGSHVA